MHPGWNATHDAMLHPERGIPGTPLRFRIAELLPGGYARVECVEPTPDDLKALSGYQHLAPLRAKLDEAQDAVLALVRMLEEARLAFDRLARTPCADGGGE